MCNQRTTPYRNEVESSSRKRARGESREHRPTTAA